MLNIRAFISVSVMVAVVVLAAPRFTLTARACPPPPEPLRTLYVQSDLIVVARIGKTAVAERRDGYPLFRTELAIWSTHKGQPNSSLIYLYHWWYDEKNPKIKDECEEGDQLLLFLQRREESGGYQVSNVNYGVKKLSEKDLQTYLDRIEELAKMMEHGKPKDEQIVEWLVRCAEEPATRWEGAYELSSQSYLFDVSDEEEEETTDEEAVAEEEVQQEEVAEEPVESGSEEESQASENVEEIEYTSLGRPDEESNTIFILLLTEKQKERLAKALYSMDIERWEDIALVNVVKFWNDPGVAKYLVSQLNRTADRQPYITYNIMYALADTLNDRSLRKLARQFLEYDPEIEAVEEGEEEEAEAAAREEEVRARTVNHQAEILKRFLSLVSEKVIE